MVCMETKTNVSLCIIDPQLGMLSQFPRINVPKYNRYYHLPKYRVMAR